MSEVITSESELLKAFPKGEKNDAYQEKGKPAHCCIQVIV